MFKSEPPVSENKINARVLSSIIIKITKSPIIIKLSYALEKKSIIPVKDSRNRESEVVYISVLLTIFLFSD